MDTRLQDSLNALSAPLAAASAPRLSADTRVSHAVIEHWSFVGRLLRHFGVRSDLDDSIQQVFITFASKQQLVEPGHERPFLAGTAVHVAARARRVAGKRAAREGLLEDEVPGCQDDPEREASRKQDLARLDRILSGMSEDLRAVFLLYEVEELTMREIAESLDLPAGTVASRLRRARAVFEAGAKP